MMRRQSGVGTGNIAWIDSWIYCTSVDSILDCGKLPDRLKDFVGSAWIKGIKRAYFQWSL